MANWNHNQKVLRHNQLRGCFDDIIYTFRMWNLPQRKSYKSWNIKLQQRFAYNNTTTTTSTTKYYFHTPTKRNAEITVSIKKNLEGNSLWLLPLNMIACVLPLCAVRFYFFLHFQVAVMHAYWWWAQIVDIISSQCTRQQSISASVLHKTRGISTRAIANV